MVKALAFYEALKVPRKVFRLNTADLIPVVGLETQRSRLKEVLEAVVAAPRAGYRHIDTVFSYRSGKEVREGIKPRECLGSRPG